MKLKLEILIVTHSSWYRNRSLKQDQNHQKYEYCVTLQTNSDSNKNNLLPINNGYECYILYIVCFPCLDGVFTKYLLRKN